MRNMIMCVRCGTFAEREAGALAGHAKPNGKACKNTNPEDPWWAPLWTALGVVLILVVVVAGATWATGWSPEKPSQASVEDGTYEAPAPQFPK